MLNKTNKSKAYKKSKIPVISLNENDFNKLLTGFWVAGFIPPLPARENILKVYESDFGLCAVTFSLKKVKYAKQFKIP